MKQQVIQAVRFITKDRYISVLLAAFLALCLAVVVFLLTQIHSSELQIVVHYTRFGTTNFYRDKWYYLLTFVMLIVLLAVGHTAISYKLLQKKGRDFTIAFLWLSMTLIFIAAALFYQILKIASLS